MTRPLVVIADLQINMISKTPGFPDARIQQEDEPYQPSYELTTNGPRVHEFIREMNDKVLSVSDQRAAIKLTP